MVTSKTHTLRVFILKYSDSKYTPVEYPQSEYTLRHLFFLTGWQEGEMEKVWILLLKGLDRTHVKLSPWEHFLHVDSSFD